MNSLQEFYTLERKEKAAPGKGVALIDLVPGTGVEPALGIIPTWPSTMRVCQFRHPGKAKNSSPNPAAVNPGKALPTTSRLLSDGGP